MKTLNETGLSPEAVIELLDNFKKQDIEPNKARLLQGIHQGDPTVKQVCQDAHNRFFHHNAFIATYEDGQKQILNELKQMVVEILNGGEEACVNITTGGSESIFCAMHAAREWARVNKPDIRQPYHIVMSRSAHAAFDKAAHYLGMELTRVPWKEDYRADLQAMEEAIQPNTIVVVGSAPMWGFGLVDPIPEIAALAQKHDLWMHSDCCVGGYLLRWMEELGHEIPTWDFRVPGVTSISADLHKHGYAAKPCSTVLYRNRELQNFHYAGVDITNWQSGSYKTEGVAGSRPFASSASAWAIMKHLGHQGWLDLTRRSLEVKNRLIEGLEAIDGFECIRNESLLVCFRSTTLDMGLVFGGVVEKGYFPFGTLDPLYIHMSAEPVSDEIIEMVLSDFRDIAKGVKDGTITGEALAKYM